MGRFPMVMRQRLCCVTTNVRIFGLVTYCSFQCRYDLSVANRLHRKRGSGAVECPSTGSQCLYELCQDQLAIHVPHLLRGLKSIKSASAVQLCDKPLCG